jgi:hypothetical protein
MRRQSWYEPFATCAGLRHQTSDLRGRGGHPADPWALGLLSVIAAASLCTCAAARGHADRPLEPLTLDVGRGAQGDRQMGGLSNFDDALARGCCRLPNAACEGSVAEVLGSGVGEEVVVLVW